MSNRSNSSGAGQGFEQYIFSSRTPSRSNSSFLSNDGASGSGRKRSMLHETSRRSTMGGSTRAPPRTSLYSPDTSRQSNKENTSMYGKQLESSFNTQSTSLFLSGTGVGSTTTTSSSSGSSSSSSSSSSSGAGNENKSFVAGNASTLSAHGAEERKNERWVTVFGFTPSQGAYILNHFQSYGDIISHKAFGQANWMHLQYKTAYQAQRALSQHEKILNGNLMIGVRACENPGVLPSEESESSRILTRESLKSTTVYKQNMQYEVEQGEGVPQNEGGESLLNAVWEYVFGF